MTNTKTPSAPSPSLADVAKMFADGIPPWLLENAEAEIVSVITSSVAGAIC
jgi:hypothetical protein